MRHHDVGSRECVANSPVRCWQPGHSHGGNSAMSGTLERISTWSGRSLAKTTQAAASASVSKVPSSREVCYSITVICGGHSVTR